MPLASWFSLQWYGPAAAAGVLEGVGAQTAGIKARARPAAALAGVGAIPTADATRLVNAPAAILGVGAIVAGPMRARARIAAPIKVGEFTQDDVSSGVLNAIVEPGVTLRDALLAARNAAKLAAALSA